MTTEQIKEHLLANFCDGDTWDDSKADRFTHEGALEIAKYFHDEGYRQAVADSNEKLVRVAERAVEQFKKEMRENTTKKICTFYGNPKQELMVYLSDVLALLDSKEV